MNQNLIITKLGIENLFVILFLSLIIILFQMSVKGQVKSEIGNTKLKVYSIDQKILLANKEKILFGDKYLSRSYKSLYSAAEKALKQGPFSVTQKQADPPSGDKHDYMSLAPYWWPDKTKSDGLPYVRRDGVVNPEVKNYPDKEAIVALTKSVYALSLTYFITSEERFAKHAVTLLQVWFVDGSTRMNPNFKYAQAIPGKTGGRGTGLIEARHFSEIIDAIGMIKNSALWNQEIEGKIKEWFSQYLTWLIESKEGQHEAAAKNNHGSWFDVQATAIALFVGNIDFAKNIVETAKTKRIEYQIDPEGKQAEELVRTKSLGYSTFNLEALFTLATMGDYLGVDLWNYESIDGRSLKKALDFLLPYYVKEKVWTYEQIAELDDQRIYTLLLKASQHFSSKNYLEYAKKFSDESRSKVTNIIYNGFAND
ncbi:MAG: hypothetical protein COT22_09325 [Ignavibacteria bacterium CG08_land_8_20_14_0_20_37_9]|nr:MAG: hypothetical protein COT22_09325 [Ignavibacteria bacterium CG08_land_8_20_14_0_20_37_9]PIX93649.1 MAG: hypothetical protein COZ25_09610 [Ignavibacteria bacterium CG_4_10_14_3_um_filter_37_18]